MPGAWCLCTWPRQQGLTLLRARPVILLLHSLVQRSHDQLGRRVPQAVISAQRPGCSAPPRGGWGRWLARVAQGARALP